MKIKNFFFIVLFTLFSVTSFAQTAEDFKQPYPLGKKISPNPNFTGSIWLAPLSEKKNSMYLWLTLLSSRDVAIVGIRTKQDKF